MPSRAQTGMFTCFVGFYYYYFLRGILPEAISVLLATTAPLALVILSPAPQDLSPPPKDLRERRNVLSARLECFVTGQQ